MGKRVIMRGIVESSHEVDKMKGAGGEPPERTVFHRQTMGSMVSCMYGEGEFDIWQNLLTLVT